MRCSYVADFYAPLRLHSTTHSATPLRTPPLRYALRHSATAGTSRCSFVAAACTCFRSACSVLRSACSVLRSACSVLRSVPLRLPTHPAAAAGCFARFSRRPFPVDPFPSTPPMTFEKILRVAVRPFSPKLPQWRKRPPVHAPKPRKFFAKMLRCSPHFHKKLFEVKDLADSLLLRCYHRAIIVRCFNAA